MHTLPIDDAVARAVAACVTAKRHNLERTAAAEQQMRSVREAGRLLALVQRSAGGRRQDNASGCLTRYQSALTQAGITRETARVWQRVSAIPDPDFERFVLNASRAGHQLTIAELLRSVAAGTKPDHSRRAVRLVLSHDEYRTYAHHVSVLGDVFGARTPNETVMVLIRRAYDAWLRSQSGMAKTSHSLPEGNHHEIA